MMAHAHAVRGVPRSGSHGDWRHTLGMTCGFQQGYPTPNERLQTPSSLLL